MLEQAEKAREGRVWTVAGEARAVHEQLRKESGEALDKLREELMGRMDDKLDVVLEPVAAELENTVREWVRDQIAKSTQPLLSRIAALEEENTKYKSLIRQMEARLWKEGDNPLATPLQELVIANVTSMNTLSTMVEQVTEKMENWPVPEKAPVGESEDGAEDEGDEWVATGLVEAQIPTAPRFRSLAPTTSV